MDANFNLITHAMLVQQAKRWVEHQLTCGVVLAEYSCSTESIPDVIGFSKLRSVIIECKVSRSDFLADRRKPHRHQRKQLGNLRYYFVLPHTVCAEDVPDPWGLIYAGDKRCTIVKHAVPQTEAEIRVAEYAILYSIARRCEIRGHLKKIQDYTER